MAGTDVAQENTKRSVGDWFDERFQTRRTMHNVLDHPVPVHATGFWYCWGGITFLLVVAQFVTGMLLTLYYKPTPQAAYASIQMIESEVRFGWLIRAIHHWSAQLLIVALIVHMGRVFFMGAYKPPRELNWTAGVFLLLVTFGFAFTGYLLPWDQKSYWATTVGTGLASAIPGIGNYIVVFLRGGRVVSGATLARFFSVHVMFLPALIILLLVAHFAMVRRQGISGPL